VWRFRNSTASVLYRWAEEMLKEFYLGCNIAVASCICAAAGANQKDVLGSTVDHDYRKNYRFYKRVYSVEKKQVRDFYMNKIMLDSVRNKTPASVGAIIVLEVFAARLDESGLAVLDSAGNLIPDSLGVVSSMEMQGNGETLKSSDDNWSYFFFSKDWVDKTTAEDRASCVQCHETAKSSQYIFTYGEMEKSLR
jgi:hypothetical protein